MATSTQITQVTQLFTALFMRAPAVSGLNYYTGRLESGATLDEVAQEMYDTAPARTYYADGATPNEIVTSFFTNTLGRAPLQGGLDYWSLQLATKTQGQVIAEMILSVTNFVPTGDGSESDTQGTTSQSLFENKVTVGEYFATVLLSTDATLAAAAYDLVTADPASVATANAANTAAVEATQSPTFTLTASASSHLEGDIGTATYTVTASKAVTADTAVTFAVSVGNATAADQGTSTTNMDDFASGTFNPVTVTIAAGATTAEFSVTGTADNLTELPETYSVTATVDGQTLTASSTLLDGAGTYNLVAAAEQLSGTVNDDTFNGSDTTVVLDQLDGKGGSDTLNFADAAGGTDLGALGATLTSIEVINVRSTAAATANTSAMTGVTNLNATAGTSAALTAATTTDVSATGITGAIVINGGKNVTVTDTATTGADITIGATTVGAGTVTVTDSKVGAGSIAVDGGTNVTITATGSSGGADTITVGNGGATTDLPSGTVSVTSAHTGVAATDVVLNAITVKGGSTVTVTQSSDTSKAAADTTGATLTQGAVTVVGGDATTSVTVTQAKSTAEVVGVTAVAGVTETASVKFTALTAGQTLIMGGLTFTASADMTAAEAAAAFANLVNGKLPAAGDSQGGGAASDGIYTGIFTGWTSGAVSTDTVVFTSTTASTDVANLANTGTGGVTVTITAGSAATSAKTGVLGVANGQVVIDDNATASITTVSVDGYADASTIGTGVSLTKLATLTLANSGSSGTAGETDAAMTVDATGVASLSLTVNNIKGNVSLDGAGDSALKTLNLTTSGAASSFALTAAAVETLNIAGDQLATLSTGTFTALKTITVTGSAGATFDADEADTLTSVTTTGTTGTVTATINADNATYTGGAGADNVTLSSTTVDKAVDLGAGNNKLTLASGTTSLTSEMIAGAGTDTLVMAAADAVTASATTTFETKITGFEKLSIGAAAAVGTVNLANLDDINHVISANGVGGAIAEVQTFTVTAGTDAAVAQIDQLTVAAGTVEAGDQYDVTIGATTFTYTTLGTEVDSAGVATAIAGVINAGTDEGVTAAAPGAGVITLTADVAGTAFVAGVALVDGTSVDAAFTDNGTTTPNDTNAGNITIEGVAVAVTAGLTVDQVGALIAAANYAATTINTVTYDAATDTVTVTYVAGVDEGATTTVDTDTTGVTFGAVGTTTAGAATGGTSPALTISNMANNGTLELTDTGSGAIVTMADATGSADVLNLIADVVSADLDFGAVTAANVETININADDTKLDDDSDGTNDAVETATLALVATKATSITITGDSNLTLTNTGNTALTTINASALTGALTVTAAGTVAETITGGSGNDVLSASAAADVLIGGAGDDTLNTGAGLATLTGGTGNDLFVVGTASTNVNSYATITDFAAGDLIKVTGTSTFKSGAVTLADTAVFQDYANAAINVLTAGQAGWFQLGGNTYIVADIGAETTVFTDGQDFVVKLTGLVDLSNASFNNDYDTIAL